MKPAYEIRNLDPEEHLAAGGIAARAMRDSPEFVAIFGSDPVRRQRGTFAMWGEHPRFSSAVCAATRNHVIGVAGFVPPGRCIGNAVLDSIDETPVRPAERLKFWGNAVAQHDLIEKHWHIGVVAVEPGLQRHGVGRAMMDEVCRRLDACGGIGFLDTAGPDNVPFYRSLGFEVVEGYEVLGVSPGRCGDQRVRRASFPLLVRVGSCRSMSPSR